MVDGALKPVIYSFQPFYSAVILLLTLNGLLPFGEAFPPFLFFFLAACGSVAEFFSLATPSLVSHTVSVNVSHHKRRSLAAGS